ncbi:MAG: KEOPS complex subunit Pcc1 [Candidatus Bathyarchaeum tardum]|nr:MAG: KEOPS complex subunit Pcc1 [Candidatus Bathyarchaeum tardum]
MNAKAVVRLNFFSDKQLHVVIHALKPEIDSASTSRSKVCMTTEGQTLILDFRAADTSALRAAMNSYLRLIGVAMNLQKFTESDF